MHANLEKKIADSVTQLSVVQQRRILSLIESLSPQKSKSKKNPLLKFAGSIVATDLSLIEDAINEGCENIDQ